MKRLFILLALFALIVNASAQERTIEKTLRAGYAYTLYDGDDADTLTPTNQDTIDYVLTVRNVGLVKKIAIKTKFNPIAGADTTVLVSLSGKEFSDDSYSDLISGTLTSAVTSDGVVQVLTALPSFQSFNVPFTNPSAGTADTLKYPTVIQTDYSKRLYRIRYIIQGDAAVGTGIEIDEIEFKLYY